MVDPVVLGPAQEFGRQPQARLRHLHRLLRHRSPPGQGQMTIRLEVYTVKGLGDGGLALAPVFSTVVTGPALRAERKGHEVTVAVAAAPETRDQLRPSRTLQALHVDERRE